MTVGDMVRIKTGEYFGYIGMVVSVNTQPCPEPWAMVRLRAHPEWCRRVVWNNLDRLEEQHAQEIGPRGYIELPREWAAGLV